MGAQLSSAPCFELLSILPCPLPIRGSSATPGGGMGRTIVLIIAEVHHSVSRSCNDTKFWSKTLGRYTTVFHSARAGARAPRPAGDSESGSSCYQAGLAAAFCHPSCLRLAERGGDPLGSRSATGVGLSHNHRGRTGLHAAAADDAAACSPGRTTAQNEGAAQRERAASAA